MDEVAENDTDKERLLRRLQYTIDDALSSGISTTEVKQIVDVVAKLVAVRSTILA